MSGIIPQDIIEQKILLIRGLKVILDSDLATLYGVTVKRFNEQVKRNLKRFPADFMIRLTKEECENMRSHFATSTWGGRRYLPYAFTEQGVAMLSGIINSDKAINVNIAIMRAFVKLREILSTHKELADKLNQLEGRLEKHDEDIHVIFKTIRALMAPPEKNKRKIGFNRE